MIQPHEERFLNYALDKPLEAVMLAEIKELRQALEEVQTLNVTCINQIAELQKNGPVMRRGTLGDGTEWMGTMREVLNDSIEAADCEAAEVNRITKEYNKLKSEVKAVDRIEEILSLWRSVAIAVAGTEAAKDKAAPGRWATQCTEDYSHLLGALDAKTGFLK